MIDDYDDLAYRFVSGPDATLDKRAFILIWETDA